MIDPYRQCLAAGSRGWFRQLAVLLLAISIIGGCGDPGTGGSGVPTANTGATDNASSRPGSGNAAAPAPGSGTTPTQGSNGNSNTGVTPVTSPVAAPVVTPALAFTYGVIAASGTTPISVPPPYEVQVAGVRFDLSLAVLTGEDGSARTVDRLLAGVPISLGYSASADLADAAVGAAGAAVRVDRATLADPLAGQLISEPAPARVLFDTGNLVSVSADLVRVGNANPGNRVRAWIFTRGNSSLVSRLEFE